MNDYIALALSVATTLCLWGIVYVLRQYLKIESPSNVSAKIDPDESLSAAFRAARTSVPQSFNDAEINGHFYRLASTPTRVTCQFCGQPSEPMTVCLHCGGAVG